MATEVFKPELDEDAIVVPIDKIDFTYYENTREAFDRKSLDELANSLRRNGQIHPIAAAEIKEEEKPTRYAVIAGYTRTEATWINVCKPLCVKYNKENKLEKGDTGYLSAYNHTHRLRAIKEYPEEFKQWKNTFPIKVNVQRKQDKLSARLINLSENVFRKDFTVAELINGMGKLQEEGMPQKKIAEHYRKSITEVSQVLKIQGLRKMFYDYCTSPENHEQILDVDLSKLKEGVTRFLEEYDRRIKMTKDEDLVIPMSTLKIAAASLLAAGGPKITRAYACELLARLVGGSTKTWELKKDEPPYNGSMIKALIEQWEPNTTAMRNIKKAPTSNPRAEQEADEEAEDKRTIEDLLSTSSDSDDADTDADIPENISEISLEEDSSTDSATETTEQDEHEKAIADYEAKKPPRVTTDDIPAKPKEVEEKTKAKSVAAPARQAQLKDQSVVLKAAATFADELETQDDEDPPSIGVTISNLRAASILYEMLSMPSRQKVFEDSLNEMVDGLEEFLYDVQRYIKTAQDKYNAPRFKGVMPRLDLPTEDDLDISNVIEKPKKIKEKSSNQLTEDDFDVVEPVRKKKGRAGKKPKEKTRKYTDKELARMMAEAEELTASDNEPDDELEPTDAELSSEELNTEEDVDNLTDDELFDDDDDQAEDIDDDLSEEELNRMLGNEEENE